MIKIYPSSAAFQEGDLVFTGYSSGCHRHALLAFNGLKEEIGEHHKERGAFAETAFEKSLALIPYVREKPFLFNGLSVPDAVVSGRIDYILFPEDPARKEIIELKSTESASVLADVIKRGKFKLNNLAQVTTYMLSEQCNNARIAYRYYKKDKKTGEYELKDGRDFKISIHDGGSILVDGNDSTFSIGQLLRHLDQRAYLIKNALVSGRPANASGFDGPCYHCPFNFACKSFDDGVVSSVEEFTDMARDSLTRYNERKNK